MNTEGTSGDGITYSSVVDAPISEVFDWHTRPGAMTRLTPPWQPVRVGQEASSLRDGRAVLLLPAGCAGWPPTSPMATTRRTSSSTSSCRPDCPPCCPGGTRNLFSAEGEAEAENETRVSDDVQTPVPASALRQMFAYRHRQLAADLAAQRWAARTAASHLLVAVTGAGGVCGTALTALLTTGGHQ